MSGQGAGIGKAPTTGTVPVADPRRITAPPMMSTHDHRAVLTLGSNLGSSLELLQDALNALADTPGSRLVAVSPVYETDPVGGPTQPPYLNVVVLIETKLNPYLLLDRGQAIEDALGRERSERWGPRTIDVDLIAYDGQDSDDEELTLPHPRAHQRAFVLAPWLDVDPAAALPGRGTVVELLETTGRAGVRRRDDLELRLPD